MKQHLRCSCKDQSQQSQVQTAKSTPDTRPSHRLTTKTLTGVTCEKTAESKTLVVLCHGILSVCVILLCSSFPESACGCVSSLFFPPSSLITLITLVSDLPPFTSLNPLLPASFHLLVSPVPLLTCLPVLTDHLLPASGEIKLFYKQICLHIGLLFGVQRLFGDFFHYSGPVGAVLQQVHACMLTLFRCSLARFCCCCSYFCEEELWLLTNHNENSTPTGTNCIQH